MRETLRIVILALQCLILGAILGLVLEFVCEPAAFGKTCGEFKAAYDLASRPAGDAK